MHQRSDRLRAFCSITIDNDFVVHDLRVIEGRKGFFVAMPSRKLSSGCPRCGAKNPVRAKFCGECGAGLGEGQPAQERDKLHVDVAHPINTACREMLQKRVLEAYREEEQQVSLGLHPRHDYSPEGLDELADEYAELDQDVEEDVTAVPQEPEEEAPAAAPRGAAEPEGGPSAEAGKEVKPAKEEPKKPRPRDSGAFGEGIL
jgi:stage V sporulation protein G